MSEKIPLTPKVKAKELIEKFRKYVDSDVDGEKGFEFSKKRQTRNAKKCALITWSEIVDELIDYGETTDELQNMDSVFRWWADVKTEIENYHE